MFEIDHETIAAYGQLSLTILTAFIAYLVFQTTRHIAKMEYLRHLTDQQQQFNNLLVNDRESFDIACSMLSDDLPQPPFKKAQISSMLLNIAQEYYLGMKNKYVDKTIAEHNIKIVTMSLAKDQDYITKKLDSVYPEDFGSYMKDRLRNLHNK